MLMPGEVGTETAVGLTPCPKELHKWYAPRVTSLFTITTTHPRVSPQAHLSREQFSKIFQSLHNDLAIFSRLVNGSLHTNLQSIRNSHAEKINCHLFHNLKTKILILIDT